MKLDDWGLPITHVIKCRNKHEITIEQPPYGMNPKYLDYMILKIHCQKCDEVIEFHFPLGTTEFIRFKLPA